MSKIIDAVSVVITCGDEIFIIQRQNFLSAFPGYWAFPGGKVEKDDANFFKPVFLNPDLDPRLFGATIRETQEELGINLNELIKNQKVLSVHCLGLAVTPDFNPFRFSTYFFKIELKEKIDFIIDENEVKLAHWLTAGELVGRYERGNILAVPPVIKIIQTLGKNPGTHFIDDLNFSYDSTHYTPFIESIKDVKQVMPLSHTLPPATRTNAFVIGDIKSGAVLIDPSPKDEEEYRKFKNTISSFKVNKIFLTHHHPDHFERSNQLARELKVPMLMSEYTHQRITGKYPDFFKDIEFVFLKEGDHLTDWLERKVIVMEVPGHDEGQLAPFSEDLSWFIAGDLFQGVGTVVIGGKEGNMSKYFHTLERIIKLNPRVLFPSHGIGLGGVVILEKTLNHRRLREEQIRTLYLEGVSPLDMLPRIYGEVDKDLWPYALENINKHLIKLKEEAKL